MVLFAPRRQRNFKNVTQIQECDTNSGIRHNFRNSREWVEFGRIEEFAEFDPPTTVKGSIQYWVPEPVIHSITGTKVKGSIPKYLYIYNLG